MTNENTLRIDNYANQETNETACYRGTSAIEKLFIIPNVHFCVRCLLCGHENIVGSDSDTKMI